jgi:cell division protein FtsB
MLLFAKKKHVMLAIPAVTRNVNFKYTRTMARTLDIRERAKFRRAMYAKPTILLLGVLAVFLLHSAWGMYQKSREAIAKRNKATAEETELLLRSDELNADISRLSTERGVEEEIRDRFMVAKEGESVIIVTDPSQERVHSVTVTDQIEPSLSERLKAAVGLSGE